MENFIKYIDIHNFKSIRDLRLEDCRRINLFIGYPNVGKSNVLEALGLFSLPSLEKGENLDKLVWVENAVELFNSLSEQNLCTIDTNLQKIKIAIKDHLYMLLNNTLYYHFSEENKYLKHTPYGSTSKNEEIISNTNNINAIFLIPIMNGNPAIKINYYRLLAKILLTYCLLIPICRMFLIS